MIELKNICKAYGEKTIIKDFNLRVEKGEFISLTGKSGSGKTTILNIIGMITQPDSGDVIINHVNNPSSKEIQKLRRNNFAYIFQNFVLMENETVKTNLYISKKFNPDFDEKLVMEVLKKVGFDESYLKKKIYQLSGGEQQRIAIARAMLKKCDIILADEPTGNLDEENKFIIIDLLLQLKSMEKTIICVTHDRDIAIAADRIVNI